jgi:hypothetical protein
VVLKHNAGVASDDFFNQPDLPPLREAYAAGLFAWIVGERHKTRIKLDDDRFPDFQLERDGSPRVLNRWIEIGSGTTSPI